jgi:hypothetical protein
MLLNVISRPGNAFTAMRHLLEDNHEPRARQRRHILRAIAIYRALLTAGVVERLPEPDAEGRIVRIVGDLQLDFALNQPLSPFVLAVVELLDARRRPTRWTSSPSSRATLDDPRPCCTRSRARPRAKAVAAMKAEGPRVRGAHGAAGGGHWPRPLDELWRPR